MEEITSKGVVNTCKLCAKVLQRTQDLKLHMTRLHKNVGVTCEKPFNDKSEVKKHIEFEYKETGSQRAEKRKHSVELESLDVKGDEEDIGEEIEILERSQKRLKCKTKYFSTFGINSAGIKSK